MLKYWQQSLDRLAFQFNFSYTLSDKHEEILSSFSENVFKVPLHFKTTTQDFKEKDINQLITKPQTFNETVSNLHEIGDQILRMDRKDVENKVHFIFH
ncbi:hypothetical protein pb186bvf_015677 [Paramecium bursaria]